MYMYILLAILIELPVYYFLLPSKDRKPELILFVALVNFISWPISMAIGNLLPIPVVNVLVFTAMGLVEGVALHYAYTRNVPLKKALLYGAGISLASFVFIRLLVFLFS